MHWSSLHKLQRPGLHFERTSSTTVAKFLALSGLARCPPWTVTADTQTRGRPTAVTSLLRYRRPAGWQFGTAERGDETTWPLSFSLRDVKLSQLGRESGCRFSNATLAWQREYSRPVQRSDSSLTCSCAPLLIYHACSILSDNMSKKILFRQTER